MFHKQTTPIDIEKTLATLKTNTPYDLSIVLYANALLQNKAQYTRILDDIQAALKTKPDDSFKAWMLGRIALAAVHMEDKTTINKTVVELKNILHSVAHDASFAWALGYLAAVNGELYKAFHIPMLKAADSLKIPTDALWAHVMNLQAAARANDEAAFILIVNQMKSFTKKATIAEALTDIPSDDWRAWAIGITSVAALTFNYKEIYNQLTQPLATSIIEATKANQPANALLAQLCANKAAELLLANSPKPF